MPNHKIEIKAFPPVAVVAPGIRDVSRGDKITFINKTGGPLKIFTAEDHVFEGFESLDPQDINTRKTFTVEASEGTYELAIHYNYTEVKKGKKKKRTGFAIGASSPKIIVVRPKR